MLEFFSLENIAGQMLFVFVSDESFCWFELRLVVEDELDVSEGKNVFELDSFAGELVVSFMCESRVCCIAIGDIHSLGIMRSIKGTNVVRYASRFTHGGMSSPQIIFFFLLLQKNQNSINISND